MANPFDQFDSVESNPFDQFDEPEKPVGGFKASAKQIIGQTIKGAGQAAADYLPLVGQDNPVKRYGQSVVDANPTAIHDFPDILDKPWTTVKEAAGNAAPSMAGMVGARAAGMGITAAAPLAGPLAPVVAAVGQGIAWLGPIAIAALPSYSGIRDKQILNDPLNQDDAKAKAIAALGAGAVGAIETRFGPQNWALAAMTKEGRAKLAEKFASTTLAGSIGKGALTGAAVEGSEELVQNPIEQLASFEDPRTPKNVRETLFGGTMGAIGGGVFGGAAGGVSSLSAPDQEPPKPELNPRDKLLNDTAEAVIRKQNAETKLTTEAANDRTKPDTAAGKKTAKAPAAEEADAPGQTVLTGAIDEAALPITQEQEARNPLAPATVAGVPADTHTDEQLQALATNPDTPANTRRAADDALRARAQAISGENAPVLSEKQARIPDETPVAERPESRQNVGINVAIPGKSPAVSENGPEITMAEVEKVRDIPTVEAMREAIAAVGDDEFQRQAQAKIDKYKPTSPDQEAMLVEATAVEIIVKQRRESAQNAPGEALPAAATTIPAQPAAPQEAAKAQPPAIRQQLFVEAEGRRYPVDSFEDASSKWEQFRLASVKAGAGGSEVPRATIVDQTGKQVAKISYNGRIWAPGEWKSGDKPLYDPMAKTPAPAEPKLDTLPLETKTPPALPQKAGTIPVTAQKSGPDSSTATITQAQNVGTSQQVSANLPKTGATIPISGPIIPNLGQPVAESAPTVAENAQAERPAGKILGADVRGLSDANIAKFAKSKNKKVSDLATADQAWRAAQSVAPERTVITPSEDVVIGKNAAGEQLYERPDGSVYRMQTGRPDFGGDLAVAEAAETKRAESPKPAAPVMEPWQMTRKEYEAKGVSLPEGHPLLKEAASARRDLESAKKSLLSAAKIKEDRYGAVNDALKRPFVSKSVKNAYHDAKGIVNNIEKQVDAITSHKAVVKRALNEGKSVPAAALADYPDLAKPAAKPEAVAAQPAAETTPEPPVSAPAEKPMTPADHLEAAAKLMREAAAQPNPEARPASPVAESQAPGSKAVAPGPGDAGVAPRQEGGTTELPIARPEELDQGRAQAAHSGTSMVPEKRAQQVQQEFADDVNGLYDGLLPNAKTDVQKAVLRAEVERYKQGYLTHMYALLGAQSRVMSSMITGPSNFPTARNQKRGNTADRRRSEFLEWRTKARQAVARAVAGSRSSEQVAEDSWLALKKDIDRNIATVKGIDDGSSFYDRPAFTNSISGKLKRMADNGEADLVRRALDYVRERQADMKKPFFAERNSVWSLVEKARESASQETPQGTEAVAEYEGASIVNNHDEQRIQISFDTIPGPDLRNSLKASGWHWSPSNKAWQRQNTDAAIVSAKQIIGAAFDEKPIAGGTPDVESYSRDEPGPGLPAADIRAHIAAITDKLSVAVPVYDSVEQARLAGFSIASDAQGFAKGDKLGLISGRIKTLLAAETTLFHELFHVGIRAVARQAKDANAAFANYTAALNRVAAANPEVRRRAKAWRDKYGAEKAEQFRAAGIEDALEARVRLTSFDEAIAEMAGDRRGKPVTRLNELIAALQRLVRALGFDRLADWAESKTDAEVLSLIRSATQAITNEARPEWQRLSGVQFPGKMPALGADGIIPDGEPSYARENSGIMSELQPNEANRAITDRLQAILQAEGQSFTITPVSLPVAVADDEAGRTANAGTIPKDHFRLAERISGLFGKQIIWMTADGPFPLQGVVNTGELPQYVFIDVRANSPAHVIFGHELAHHIQRDTPGIYKTLVKALSGVLRNHEEYRAQQGLHDYNKDQLTDEIIGDLLGDNFDRREFWNRVAKQSQGTFRSIAATIKRWLDKLVKLVTGTDGIERFVTDIHAARKALAQAVVDYAESRKQDAGKAWTDIAKSQFSRLDQTQTAEFRKWFKDSKVVDAEGKPLVVYHGTSEDFSRFNLNKLGQNTIGEASSPEFEQTSRVGHWFSDHPMGQSPEKYSAGYSTDMPVFLKMENPLLLQDSEDLAIMLHNKKGSVLRQELKAMGYDGIVINRDVEFGGSSYIAFRPEQIKSAIGNRGTFDPGDPDIMHARAGDALAKAIPQLARNRMAEMADYLIYNYQDRFHMLPRIQKRLHPGALPEGMDANLAVEAYPKVVAAKIKDFQDDYVGPFVKLLHDSKLTVDQAQEYLNAKDAPDRNREMKARNPTEAELDALKSEAAATRNALAGDENVQDYIAKRRELRQAEADVEDGLADQTLVDMTKAEIAALRKEKTVKDYAAAVDKIKALQGIQPFEGDNTALSGMTDARAAEVIAKARQDGTSDALELVSASIDAITAKTRQILVENGLAKPEEIAAWEASYPHYVPRFRDEVTEGTPHPVGQGMQVRGKESKRATGSTKEVTNILAHVMAAHEAAVIRAEKVKADRALFSFLAAHPDNDVAELDVDAKVRDVDEKTGLVVERVDWAYKNKANVLTLKIDGDEHTITFNEDNPEALRLAASMKNLSAQDIGEITAMVGKFTRFLATMNTAANPVFVARNFLRDSGTAFINLSDTELADTKKRVFADIPKAIRGFWDMTRGNMNSEWAKSAREFRDAGGQMGFLQHYKDILARAETLEKQLADMAPGKLNFTKEKARSYWHLIEDANLAVENGVRLSAYVNARRNGLTQAKAISLASNLTVNFTKRGARGVELNMWYMFMNASIQGTARLIKAMGNKNVQKILAYVIVSSFLLDMLNRGLAGDDDDDGENDYDQLPDYTKANNFVLYLGRPITIPLPYGYNFFASVGRTMSEAMFRKDFSAAKSAANLASIFVDAFSPMGQSGDLLQFAAPTIADPFVQWAENKNFAGNPLRREQFPFGPPKPEYQMGFKSTSAPAKGLAEALNDWTGGNEVRPGLINLNPAAFDFAITALLGGAGRTYLQMVSLPVKIAMGEEIQAREVPFLNIVASAKPEYQIERKFYETIREVETTKEELNTYRGDPDMLREIRKDHAAEIRVIGMARGTQAILENIRKQERMLEKNKPEDWRARAKRLEERKRVLMSRFNKTYTEARQ